MLTFILRTFLILCFSSTFIFAGEQMQNKKQEIKHNENDVKAFIYQWFSGFDKQREEAFFLKHLSDNSKLQYPDFLVASKKDFHTWYQKVKKTIAWNRHTIRRLEVYGDEETGWAVTYTVQWEAKTYAKENIDLKIKQHLHVVHDGQFFKIMKLKAKVRNLKNQETHLTSLMKAAGYGDLDKVKALIKQGANIFTLDPITGSNVMHLAAQGGSVPVMKELIKHGAMSIINSRIASNNFTPLMIATWYQNPDMIRYLLSLKHINPLLKDHYGRTAADFPVVSKGYKELHPIDQEIVSIYKNYFKKRKKHIETHFEANKITPKNLPKDVNIRIPNGGYFDQHTPLLVASLVDNLQEFKRLVKMGADLTAEGEFMKAIVAHKAGYKGNPEIMEEIVQHPDFYKIKNAQGPTNGYTPLHDAIWHGHTKTAKILIEAGVDTSIRAWDGMTPLDLAKKLKYKEIIKLLKK